jgi:hypothetical protein
MLQIRHRIGDHRVEQLLFPAVSLISAPVVTSAFLQMFFSEAFSKPRSKNSLLRSPE